MQAERRRWRLFIGFSSDRDDKVNARDSRAGRNLAGNIETKEAAVASEGLRRPGVDDRRSAEVVVRSGFNQGRVGD